PTAPQPKPSTESRIPVRPKTRRSIAVPPKPRSLFTSLSLTVFAETASHPQPSPRENGEREKHRQSPGLKLPDCDRHFSEMRAARHMGERLLHLIEGKGPVDHRLHAIDRDRIRHRLEIFN